MAIKESEFEKSGHRETLCNFRKYYCFNINIFFVLNCYIYWQNCKSEVSLQNIPGSKKRLLFYIFVFFIKHISNKINFLKCYSLKIIFFLAMIQSKGHSVLQEISAIEIEEAEVFFWKNLKELFVKRTEIHVGGEAEFKAYF